MSAILAEVRSRPLALALTLVWAGCGASRQPAPPAVLKPLPPAQWRAGSDRACERARSLLAPLQAPNGFREAELVAAAVALAVRQELDGTALLGPPPPLLIVPARRLRRVREAILVELLHEVRASRRRDLRAVHRSIRRLTPLSHAATTAAFAAGLRVCGHELDRGTHALSA